MAESFQAQLLQQEPERFRDDVLSSVRDRVDGIHLLLSQCPPVQPESRRQAALRGGCSASQWARRAECSSQRYMRGIYSVAACSIYKSGLRSFPGFLQPPAPAASGEYACIVTLFALQYSSNLSCAKYGCASTWFTEGRTVLAQPRI